MIQRRSNRGANEIRMELRHGRKTPGTVSLQDTLETGRDGTALTVQDTVQDDSHMEEDYERDDEAGRLHRLIDRLNGRERQVILLRYGLGGQPPLTQQQVAQMLNISRSYVSRIETRALKLLRQIHDQVK